jgi:hypothetical protein
MVLALILAAFIGNARAEAQDPVARDGPEVLEISEPVLKAFERGLRTEIALRAEFRKELAALKTREEYQRCYGTSMTSPAAQKLAEPMMNVPAGTSPEEYQRRTTRAGERLQAFLLKSCGPDPIAFNDSWKAKRLEEIERRAADAAGPLP